MFRKKKTKTQEMFAIKSKQKIPYTKIFPNENIIETQKNIFAKIWECDKTHIFWKDKSKNVKYFWEQFLQLFNEKTEIQFVQVSGKVTDEMRDRRNIIAIQVHADTLADAKQVFDDIKEKLKALEECTMSVFRELSTWEQLELLYHLYHLFEEKTFEDRIADIENVYGNKIDLLELNKKVKLTSKDLIGTDITVSKEDNIELKKNKTESNSTFCQALYLQNLEEIFVNELLQTILEEKFPVIISLQLASRNDEEENKIFFGTLLFVHFAKEKEILQEQKKKLEKNAKQYLNRLIKLNGNQKEAFDSCLPLATNRVHLSRVLPDSLIKRLIPFSGKESE